MSFLILNCKRPKGGFGLTAATLLRPQGPSLIAAVTETFGRKRIAAEMGPFGRKKLFRWLCFHRKASLSAEMGPFGRNYLAAETAVRLMVLRPQPKDSFGRKMRP